MVTESKSNFRPGQSDTTLPNRFYKKVEAVVVNKNTIQVVLDSNALRTPGRNSLDLPSFGIAEQIVKEWQAQEEHVDLDTMPYTTLCYKAIDHIAVDRDSVIKHIVSYAESDLICYFAEEPEELVRLQSEHWSKIIAWTRTKFNINLKSGSGIVYIPQPEDDMAKLGKFVGQFNNFALAALHNMVSLTGSVFIPLSFIYGENDSEVCWRASRVDEDWQNSRWGVDEVAHNDALRKRSEFDIACRFIRNLDSNFNDE